MLWRSRFLTSDPVRDAEGMSPRSKGLIDQSLRSRWWILHLNLLPILETTLFALHQLARDRAKIAD